MTSIRITRSACAAASLASGTASAAPVTQERLGLSAPGEAVAMSNQGTEAGRMKQRRLTRTMRCENVPSRC